MTNILQGDEHHPTTVRVSTHDVTHAGHHECGTVVCPTMV